jgi:hypothetical protein
MRMTEQKRAIEYEVPSDETLLAFAKQVSERLSEQVHPSFAQHEVIRGLASFLTTIATIQVNRRNRGNLFDAEDN